MILELLIVAVVIIGAYLILVQIPNRANRRGVTTAAGSVVSSAMVYARAGDVAPETTVLYTSADQSAKAAISVNTLAKDTYIRVAVKSVTPDAKVIADPADVKPGADTTAADMPHNPYISVAEGDASSGRAAALDVPVVADSGRLSTYESDKNYIGSRLGDATTQASPNACAVKCLGTPGCASWLHLADGNCWMYSNITGESAICSGCKSGRVIST